MIRAPMWKWGALLIAAAACVQRTPSSAPQWKAPGVEPTLNHVPVRLAVYYSEQSRTVVARDDSPRLSLLDLGGGSGMYGADVGPAVVEIFDRLFGDMFATAEQASSAIPPAGEPPVLEVAITRASATRGVKLSVSVTCTFVLRDSRGEIARWAVTGAGEYGRVFSESIPARAGKASILAVTEVARQFADGVARQPGFAEWLASR